MISNGKKQHYIAVNNLSCGIIMRIIIITIVTIILKNHTHRKKLSKNLPVGQCLQDVHLIKKKIKLNYYRGKDCIKKLCKKLKV